MSYVINLFGEAGVGKSVTASGLHYRLSINGYSAEIAHEVAKRYTWESPVDPSTNKKILHPLLDQQIHILGEQNRNILQVYGKVDFVIAECPLLIGLLYARDDYYKSFLDLSLEMFHSYRNINILLEREHTYDENGRNQTEIQSKEVRDKLIQLLHDNHIPYHRFRTSKNIDVELLSFIRNKGLLN